MKTRAARPLVPLARHAEDGSQRPEAGREAGTRSSCHPRERALPTPPAHTSALQTV